MEDLEKLIQYLGSRKKLYEQQLTLSIQEEESFRHNLTKEELEEFRNTCLELIFTLNQEIAFHKNCYARLLQ